jgi:hypothetical protein
MALSQYLDFTATFNANSGINIEIGSWDYVIVQLVTPSGAVTFNTTNDDGGANGTGYGSAESAVNWIAVQGTNLNTGTAVTSLNASGLVRFGYIGQFLQLTGSSVTAVKVIVRYFKIG